MGMQEKTLIRVAVGLSTAVWIGVIAYRGSTLSISLLSSFGAVLAIIGALMAVFDRFLWRMPLIHRAFRDSRPLIRGTWRGEVRSSRREEPFNVFLLVEQTLSSVSVKMLTETGWSETLASRWGKSDQGDPAVFYVWRRFPNSMEHTDGADDADLGYIQYGAGVIEVCGDFPYSLKGPYWTSEQHIGRMSFEGGKRKLCRSFVDAVELFPKDTLD